MKDWIVANAKLIEAKFGFNESERYMYGNVSQTQFSIARHYGGVRINGKYFDYVTDGDLLIREDVFSWIARQMKKNGSPRKQ